MKLVKLAMLELQGAVIDSFYRALWTSMVAMVAMSFCITPQSPDESPHSVDWWTVEPLWPGSVTNCRS